MRAVRQLKTLAYCGGLTRRQSSRKWHSATLHVSSREPDEINCLRKFRTFLTRANNLMAQISPDTHFAQAPLLLFTSFTDNMDARQIFTKIYVSSLSHVHARERIALGRCFKCQHEAGFLSSSHAYVSSCMQVYACVYTYVYVTCSRLKYCSSFPRRCTTRYCWKHRSENFSVWMYLRVRPYGYTLVPLHSGIPWHSRNPHPTRKVGINVNRMSTYVVRERRLCDDVLEAFCFSLWFIYAIFAIEEFSLS